MARLIDADALEKELNNERERFVALDMKGAEHILVHSALRLLREAPTIDAVPADVAPIRRGRWLCDENALYHCSECSDVQTWDFNYCPSCGAKMGGESDE